MPSETDVVRTMMALHAEGKNWIRAKDVAEVLGEDSGQKISWAFMRLSKQGRIESFTADGPHVWRLKSFAEANQ